MSCACAAARFGTQYHLRHPQLPCTCHIRDLGTDYSATKEEIKAAMKVYRAQAAADAEARKRMKREDKRAASRE